MRLAHVTDIHVQVPPRVRQLGGKRLLGAANLYVAGRKSHFTMASQRALVEAVTAQAPDALVCTGDLTALATPEEFDAAHALLAPLFSAQPTALIPGNHDTYTRGAWIERRIEALFGEWTGQGDWPRLHLIGDALALVAIDVSKPEALLSRGLIDEAQLDGLDTLLGDARLAGRFVVVMLHYPLRDRRGQPYGPDTRNIRGARLLEQVLLAHVDTVNLIVHGHEHHGFRTQLSAPDGRSIYIIDPGAGGYAFLPAKRRTAHFCVYTLDGQALVDVERFAFDGQRFVPEAGGAFASGG